MKKLIYIFLIIPLLGGVRGGFSLAQQPQKCGTMQYLDQLISENPSLKSKIDLLEEVTQVIIKQKHPIIAPSDPATPKNQKQDGAWPCTRNNILHQTFAAPALVGDSVSSGCINAGKYNRITNMVAGYVYEIHTCYGSNFDTQITIYNADDGLVDAYNDDYCGLQSAIYFTPLVSGNYEILIDEYDCADNLECANLVVKLFYKPRPVITIPVVVHVVYNASVENITDAQIYSQINILNTDFRRLNTGIYSAPVAFRGVSTDPLFEFCLAQRDPYGNPTNGITRTYTIVNIFDKNCSANCIFFDDTDGKDAWNTSQYLNIWVCDMNKNPLGLAFLPGTAPPEIDGIVIDYKAFGNIGSAEVPTDLGRTATHEVGHWLGLYHLWNDANCGDDLVFDTPPQKHSHYGCPGFPETHTPACSGTGETGEMFVNFMDYTDDNCMSIFTYGQFARMDNTIYYPRQSLQASQGCTSTTAMAEPPAVNYGIKVFPNPNTGVFTFGYSRGTVQNRATTHTDVQLTITNMLGQQIYSATINDITKQIDISNHGKGIYLLQLTTKEGIISKKIVIE